jgi:hypothetical protein
MEPWSGSGCPEWIGNGIQIAFRRKHSCCVTPNDKIAANGVGNGGRCDMSEAQGAIYAPPKDGLPYLVVTYADGGWKAQPTLTRSEARVLLAKRTRHAKAAAPPSEGVVRLGQR